MITLDRQDIEPLPLFYKLKCKVFCLIQLTKHFWKFLDLDLKKKSRLNYQPKSDLQPMQI